MTNPNDLRDILREDADGARVTPTNELLTGIQHKAKVRRRTRRVGAAAVIAAVVAVTATVGPRFVDSSSPDPVDPAPERPELEFPTTVFPEALLASHVNDPGTSSFRWETTTGAPIGSAYIRCQIPAGVTSDLGAKPVLVGVAIEGEVVTTEKCTTLDAAKQRSNRPRRGGLHYSADRPLLMRLLNKAARSGQSYVISMWLEQDGSRINLPRAEFGIGLYSIDSEDIKGG